MIGIGKLSRRLVLLFAIGLIHVSAYTLSQAKAEEPEPVPFLELPENASKSLGDQDIGHVIVFTKEGQLITFYGRSVGEHGSITFPPDPVIDVQNANDPDKDIIVTATIPRSYLQVPGQPIEPIEVIPAILIKVGPSTCGWNIFYINGVEHRQWVCT